MWEGFTAMEHNMIPSIHKIFSIHILSIDIWINRHTEACRTANISNGHRQPLLIKHNKRVVYAEKHDAFQLTTIYDNLKEDGG